MALSPAALIATNKQTLTGTFNGTIGTSSTLNLYEHFKPTEIFGRDSANTLITLTFISGKHYLVIANSQKDDGVYYYFRAFTVTCASDGTTSITNNDDPEDTAIIATTAGSTANQITIKSNHNSYRLHGMVFRLN
jgi:hypothetical protein